MRRIWAGLVVVLAISAAIGLVASVSSRDGTSSTTRPISARSQITTPEPPPATEVATDPAPAPEAEPPPKTPAPLTPEDERKMAPAPDEGPSDAVPVSPEDMAAKSENSAACVGPDGSSSGVVMWTPGIDPATGEPLQKSEREVVDSLIKGMPEGTTCKTHDEISAGR